jgi:hypothetical protein
LKIDSLEDIPKRATIVKEFIRCGNPKCGKKHGPYMYAYWKEKGRLRKVYIGKSMMDLKRRILCEKAHQDTGLPLADAKKMLIITQYAREGNEMAIQYSNKIVLKKCSPAWGYRKLSEHLRQASGITDWRPTVRITK